MKDQDKLLYRGGDPICFSAITVLVSALGIGVLVILAWILELTA